ncbi:hypothetical protein C8R47DRAFT_1077368 [Mycena vitilis]|nr:hypothetical protein C8R47DRAFT_1077368 [Mycena vitilis]
MGAHEQPRSIVRGAGEQQHLSRSMPQHRALSERPHKSMRERGLCSTSGTDTPAIAPAVADPRLAALHGGGENAVTSLARQLHPIVPLVAADGLHGRGTAPMRAQDGTEKRGRGAGGIWWYRSNRRVTEAGGNRAAWRWDGGCV